MLTIQQLHLNDVPLPSEPAELHALCWRDDRTNTALQRSWEVHWVACIWIINHRPECVMHAFKQFTVLCMFFPNRFCLHWTSPSFLLWIKNEKYYFKGDKSESCFTVHHTTRDPVCVSGREYLGSGNLSRLRWQTGAWWHWTTDYLACRAIWDAN